MDLHDVPVLAGTVSTLLFVVSYLPMLVKAFRTRDLESYSLGNLLIANVGNGVHSIYVFSLPHGPDLVPARLLRRLDRGDAALAPAVRRAASEGGEASGGAPRARSRLSGMTDALISSAYSQALEVIASVEPRIADATRQELADQRGSLKLIASENYASPAVLLTMGTWFSDKYAEGTIGHRFYAGCQNVDTVESIAAEHARELFGAPYAYVQPHSGIDANLVGVLVDPRPPRRDARPSRSSAPRTSTSSPTTTGSRCAHELGNQRLLGMSLDAGGHLTHGFRPNISGKMFHQQQYGTDPETGLLDYDKVAAKAREFKPLVLVAGYSAYPRRVNFAKMREIADEVGATLMVDMAHFAGLVAGKVFTGEEDPVPLRPHHHHDDPQVAARPARRHGAGPGGVREATSTAAARWSWAGRSRTSWRPRRSRWPRPGPTSSAPTPRTSPTTRSRWPRASSPAAPTWSPAAPTTTSCCSTCRRSGSPAARPSPPCSTRAWSPTATPSRPTRTAPGTPPASGSVRRRSRRAGSVTTSSTTWPS